MTTTKTILFGDSDIEIDVVDHAIKTTADIGDVTIGAITVADGANVVEGATTGAAVITDTTGTLQQYLRGLVKLIAAKINVKVADGENAVEGVTTGAAVITDATGTIQQYLRGLVKLVAAKINIATVDAITTITNAVAITNALLGGATSDAAVVTDATGSIHQYLRGLVKLIVAKINIATVDTVTAVTKIFELVPGVGATDLGKAEDAVAASGDTGVMSLAIRSDTPAATAGNGDYHPLEVGANGELFVGLATKLDSTNDSITAVGAAAHDAAVSGNPVRVGAKALSADQTVVNTGDAVDLMADLIGRQVVVPYALPQNLVDGHTVSMTDTAAHAIIAAQAAGIRTYLTQITITNGHASVDTWVDILDGSTVRYSVFAPHLGGGASITLPDPLIGTAATAWNAQNRTTGAAVEVSASGHKGV